MVLNILVIGSGGREHTITWKLLQSPRINHIYVAPGNGGTATMGDRVSNVPITEKELDKIVEFAKTNHIYIVFIGPEAPLVDGLSDKLKSAGILSFGPTQNGAILEGSKRFSKDFMSKYDIPTAKYKSFTDYNKAVEYINCIDIPFVIKASGIAGGKGVVLPDTKEEAVSTLKSFMLGKLFGDSGLEVVIEERLSGEEVSFLVFTDGKTFKSIPPSQDHKRVGDNDTGPNTGGMGCYCPTSIVTPLQIRDIEEKIVQRTLSGLNSEGITYCGIIYIGLMVTKDGIKVLEYNCRFGDPETQVIIPLLDSDLFDIIEACCKQTLSSLEIKWKNSVSCCVVLISGGYPGSFEKGKLITGVNRITGDNILFHSGTIYKDNHYYTNSGRVLALVSISKTLKSAIQQLYSFVPLIRFDNIKFRSDIGQKGLKHPLRLGILGSTKGTDMTAIIDAINNKQINAEIALVISNRKLEDDNILGKAKKYNIPYLHVPCKKSQSKEEYDQLLVYYLKQYGCDLILCIGYMKILTPIFCSEFSSRCINVHPSLLPDFAGGMNLDVHKAVIDAKKTESGCTFHYVTPDVDCGPILLQKKCPVTSVDTPDSLKTKVQKLEGEGFIEIINNYINGLYDDKNKNGICTYSKAGVNIDAGNEFVEQIKELCKATSRPGGDVNLGGFGGLFDLGKAGYVGDDVMLVSCNDGVGTKLKVAIDTNIHNTVGIDLVAMSVNDLIVQGAEPLFFLDYIGTGKLEVNISVEIMKGISEGCRQANCALIGGETAEMPSMYNPKDYDLAGFAVGAVYKSHMLPKEISPGDIVLGLPSTGVHSNGYSLVRYLVKENSIRYDDFFPYNKNLKVSDVLLSPTKIYVKMLLDIIKLDLIKGLAHITGGGLVENIPRVLGAGVGVTLNPKQWKVPDVFKWLGELGNIEESEMVRTFNCGIGMIVVVSPENVEKVRQMISSHNETVYEIGKVEERTSGDIVQFSSKLF